MTDYSAEFCQIELQNFIKSSFGIPTDGMSEFHQIRHQNPDRLIIGSLTDFWQIQHIYLKPQQGEGLSNGYILHSEYHSMFWVYEWPLGDHPYLPELVEGLLELEAASLLTSAVAYDLYTVYAMISVEILTGLLPTLGSHAWMGWGVGTSIGNSELLNWKTSGWSRMDTGGCRVADGMELIPPSELLRINTTFFTQCWDHELKPPEALMLIFLCIWWKNWFRFHTAE